MNYMKNQETLLPIMLLSLALTGCAGMNPKALGPLTDMANKVAKITQAQNGLLPVPNLFNITDPSLFQLSDRTCTIANGSTNYTVKIHYSDLNLDRDLQFTNAVAEAFKFEQSLFGLTPELPQLMGNSDNAGSAALQHFFGTFSLMDNLKNIASGLNFRTNLNAHVRELLDDQLASVAENTSTDLSINVSLDGLTAAYLKAYLDGNFVDRWGTPISGPDFDKLGNDTTVASTKVLMEALFDFINMTPVIHDPSSTNQTPTFAVVFPVLYETISTNSDARGVTSAENEAIKYLSGLGNGG
jgi:hypothetical protein